MAQKICFNHGSGEVSAGVKDAVADQVPHAILLLHWSRRFGVNSTWASQISGYGASHLGISPSDVPSLSPCLISAESIHHKASPHSENIAGNCLAYTRTASRAVEHCCVVNRNFSMNLLNSVPHENALRMAHSSVSA